MKTEKIVSKNIFFQIKIEAEVKERLRKLVLRKKHIDQDKEL